MPRIRYPTAQHFDALKAQQLIAYIRKGAYEHVAADAAGVPRDVYEAWVARGERPGARPPFREFARAVRMAKATGRVLAETEVHKKDPKFWLQHGVGRDQPGSPGWAGAVKPHFAAEGAAANVLTSPQWQALWQVLQDVLPQHPEARAALLQALRGAAAFVGQDWIKA